MNQDLSIVNLVLHASPIVQIVIAGLMFMSVSSWTVIFAKLFGLKRVRGSNDDFEREFWSGRSLNELHQAVDPQRRSAPMERIFASGMREFLKLRERRLEAGAQIDGARRAMRASSRSRPAEAPASPARRLAASTAAMRPEIRPA